MLEMWLNKTGIYYYCSVDRNLTVTCRERIFAFLPMLIHVVMFSYIIAGSLCLIVSVLSCVGSMAACSVSVVDCHLLK